MRQPTTSGLPGLASFLHALESQTSAIAIDQYESLLKRRQIQGPRDSAVATVELYRHVLEHSEIRNISDLRSDVRRLGQRFIMAQPNQFTIGNVVRRILGLITEISEPKVDTNADMESKPSSSSKAASDIESIKSDLLEGLAELRDEIDSAEEQIAGYANEHLHASDTILTFAASKSIQRFLLNAAKRSSARGYNLTVICVEGFPYQHVQSYENLLHGVVRNNTEEMENEVRLKTLSSAGLNVVCIPDSAVFAVMPRVTKVLLPSTALFNDGSAICPSGSRAMSKAAKLHRVPVIVLGAVFTLVPSYPFESNKSSVMEGSRGLIDYQDGQLLDNVKLIEPLPDQMGPDGVDMVITNIGGHVPSFMYRIALDHYRRDDMDLAS